MRRYSAGEAIGPAWEHTKALMWQERRWGRLLKLSLVAIGAEMGSGANFNFTGGNFGNHSGGHKFTSGAEAGFLIAFVLVLAVFALAIYVAFLYLGSRLQLAQFDILVLRDPFVAPAWSRHGRHTWRWAGLRLCLTLGSLLVLAPLLLPALPIFLAFGRAIAAGAGHLHAGLIFEFIAVLLVFLLLFMVLARLTISLVLPGLAMEDLRFGAALRRGWELFRTDVPGMIALAFLQPLFQLLLGIAVVIAMLLALLLMALPFALIGGLLWLALRHAGTAGWIAVGVYAAVAGVAVLFAWLLVYLAVSGTLLTFSRAWSLYFLGGRYPLLGQYLEPGPAVPVWTPPPSFPRDDNSSGPDFPANPALA